MSDENEAESKDFYDDDRNLGTQPIDAVMIEHGLSNTDLVEASPHPLTHKAVRRARTGRKLTSHTMQLVIGAMTAALRKRKIDFHCSRDTLFTYKP